MLGPILYVPIGWEIYLDKANILSLIATMFIGIFNILRVMVRTLGLGLVLVIYFLILFIFESIYVQVYFWKERSGQLESFEVKDQNMNQTVHLIKDRFLFLSEWWVEDLFNYEDVMFKVPQLNLQYAEQALWLIGKSEEQIELYKENTAEFFNKIYNKFQLQKKNLKEIYTKSPQDRNNINNLTQQIQKFEVSACEFYHKVYSDYQSALEFFDERVNQINPYWKQSMEQMEKNLICNVASTRLWFELLKNRRFKDLQQNLCTTMEKLFIRREDHSYNRLAFWFQKVAVTCSLVSSGKKHINFDKIKFVNACQAKNLQKQACIIDTNGPTTSKMVSFYKLENILGKKVDDKVSFFWAFIVGEIKRNWNKQEDDFSYLQKYKQGQATPPLPTLRASVNFINIKLKEIDAEVKDFSESLVDVLINKQKDNSEINKILDNKVEDTKQNYDIMIEKVKIILEDWKIRAPQNTSEDDIFEFGRCVNFQQGPFETGFSPFATGIQMIKNEHQKKGAVLIDLVVQIFFGILVDFVIILVCTEIIAFVYSQTMISNCPGFSLDIFINRLSEAAAFVTNIDTSLEIE
eukprot:TRINITY_DN17145_c0_g1_i1.p1 TRINITY_DN17145_c0_g1~~TRINITY_DN17145_c0_g1_i1.p1  ORF type:complete len:577 (-),score=37.18 TRINITY_DN17145_c0_g1_i1:300-2030(-)